MKHVLLEMSRFASVGVLATLVGLGGTLFLYNGFGLGYWASSALAFVAGALVSFFLNRRFTFRDEGAWVWALVRFALNVAVCYGIAFGVARPATLKLLAAWNQNLSVSVSENLSLAVGNGLYTLVNYLGQKWFVFHKGKA